MTQVENKKCTTRQVAYILMARLPADVLAHVCSAIYDTEHDHRISDQQVIVAESILDHIDDLLRIRVEQG